MAPVSTPPSRPLFRLSTPFARHVFTLGTALALALVLLVLLASLPTLVVVLLLLRGAGFALLVLLIGLPALIVGRLLLHAFAVGFVAHGGRSLIAPETSGGEFNGAERRAFLSRKSDNRAGRDALGRPCRASRLVALRA
jgi:hypothetical protein